jgi:NAD dependent epimerase/dehydratase family enzyme
MNVLIAGGSGLLGKQITNVLLEQGHNVSWLTRTIKSESQNAKQFH